MMTPDEIKRSLSSYILGRVVDAALAWASTTGAEAHVFARENLAIQIKVYDPQGQGPRFFEVRVSEKF